MQNFFELCIFCSRRLQETERRGRGDHVIPEYLYGSVCIKDVCTYCNKALGSRADHKALEDGRIIAAAFELNLPELQTKIRDRGAGIMIDPAGESVVHVRFREGQPRVVPKRVSEELFVCDERDTEAHLLNILRRNPPNGVNQGEIERIVRDGLMPKYNRLWPGDSVSQPTLGLRLRKAPGRIHQEWKVTEGACERLVAKIGYEIAFFAFDRDRLAGLPVLQELADVAMGQGRLSESVFMYPIQQYSPVNAPPHGPKYHHQIIVWYEEIGNIIDIYLFGCVGFRLFLRGDSRAAHGPFQHPDGDISMASVVMTFEPGASTNKYIFLKRAGSNEIEECAAARIL